MARAQALEKRIGYRFRDPALLAQALTHRSFGSPHNERLEFVGDGILGCVIAEALYTQFPDVPEGKLHRARSALVRGTSLAAIAAKLELGGELRVGKATASNVAAQPTLLANGLEAVLGAVFIDGGYEAARQTIVRIYGEALAALDPEKVEKDSKTTLQERLLASRHAIPVYRLVSSHGPQQRLTFEVECAVPDLALRTLGTGTSRQRAEQAAAAAMLKLLPRGRNAP